MLGSKTCAIFHILSYFHIKVYLEAGGNFKHLLIVPRVGQIESLLVCVVTVKLFTHILQCAWKQLTGFDLLL